MRCWPQGSKQWPEGYNRGFLIAEGCDGGQKALVGGKGLADVWMFYLLVLIRI